jgi:integrase
LSKCRLVLRIEEITNQHAQNFARQGSDLSQSGINRGLQTLRRALNLAFAWGKLEKPCKLTLASDEHQRDRVLTEREIQKYLGACPQPWKDCAVLISDEGFRPSDVFALHWTHCSLERIAIQIADGKSRAARRVLPMMPGVQTMLLER